MKKTITFIIILLSLSRLSAQENTLSTGGEANGSDGSLSFSVGQIAVQYSSEDSNTPTIPTTTGELANDAGFITAADIPDSVSFFVNDAGYITKDSIPNTVSTFINDANYITKDSIPANVSAFINDAGYLTSYTEVQALSISNDTIFLTNGGFVKLPAGFFKHYFASESFESSEAPLFSMISAMSQPAK